MAKRQDFERIALPDVASGKRLEEALACAEAAFGVRLTVSDHAALFLDASGEPALPPARRRHELPYCEWGRRRPAWDQACLAHCGRAVPLQAAEYDRPFAHCCWKGAAEIVVPVHYEGAHACTLFAGLWRSPHPYQAPLKRGGAPPELEALRAELPELKRAELARLAGPLQLFGAGLVSLWLGQLRWGGEADRAARIRRFIHLRAHEQVKLADLARYLALSPSRTGALARACLGRPFQEALSFERIRRARTLLRQTRRSVKEIARRVGFNSEYYFNRAFKREVGEAPGRWRRRQVR
ncbi:MAG: AraC family transcriptional regulator [Planctomycetota bacterium]|nr:AraC family transcriptional regulator [Planctomycetota bacterium]